MYEPGDSVFVIERSPTDKPMRVTGYMFIALACGYAICSCYNRDYVNVKSIMKCKAMETSENTDTNFCVFRLDDLYDTYESAIKAMNIEECTKK